MPDKILEQICLDDEREARTGFVETIFAEGKSLEQLKSVIFQQLERGRNIFATRVNSEVGAELVRAFPGLGYDPLSRTILLRQKPLPPLHGLLGIIAAGTSDVAVAEEAKATAYCYGLEVKKFYDCGVAGLHRLLSQLKEIRRCDCLIVIAGMDGALPSVVAGLVSVPVIACPTSVGYGAHLKGFAPLFNMLNCCAEGLSVVNIDNGFGAACAALRIFRAKQKTI